MSQYDLGFYKPDEWYADAVITTAPIEHDDDTVEPQQLPDYRNLFLSFGTGNFGEVLSDAFFVDVYVDGEYYRSIKLDPIQAEDHKTFTNLQLGTFSAGPHYLEMKLASGPNDEDTSNNFYETTFTVENTGRGSYFNTFYGGDTFNLDCVANFELDYGKYTFSGNFIGSEAGRKVNARMEMYNSHNQRIFSATIKNGKFKGIENVVLTKGAYKVYILSTDYQKTADTITLSVTGEVYYKSDYGDNSIALVSNVDRYTVLVQDAPRTIISNGWVGLGDTLSLRRIEFDFNGKYTFTVNTTDKVKVSVIQVTTDAKGKKKEKKVASTTISAKKKYGKDVDISGVLLARGTYFLQVEALKADKGTNADYSVKVSSSSVFYIDCDDGTNNWLYEKKRGLNDASFVETDLMSYTTDVYLDQEDVSKDGYDNFVGFGDAVDFAKIRLFDTATISFSLNATDAAKFVIYSLTEKKGGKYTMKALQTTKLKKATKDATEFTAETKALSLAAGNYFISMESTNAKKGGSAYYNVTLNSDACFWPAEENLEACLTGSLNTQDELSFGRNALEEALVGASGAALAELDDKSAWLNLLA